MHQTGPRIAVIGGGITGAFAAYFLSRCGAQATVIERDHVAAGASGHNHGGLNPLHGQGIPGPLQDLAMASLRLHLGEWDAIRRLSGHEFGSHRAARLHVAMCDSEAEQLQSRASLHNGTPGCSARWMTGAEARRAEPRLCPDAVGGLWTTGNSLIDPAPYTRAVAAAAIALGATVVDAEARELRHKNGRVTSVALDSGGVECDGVVIASGACCREPEDWLGTELPVEPLKGEMLLVETSQEPPHAEVTWNGTAVYGGRDDRLWLGGTEDYAGFNSTPTLEARTRILDGVRRLLPGLARTRVVSHIAGLRPVTPDGLPIVGVPRGWENVCVALGGGRKGMLLGAGLGLASAELLTKGDTRVPLAGCAPDRWRD